MQAIVDLNGKQYQIQEGRYIEVDRLSLEPDAEFELNNVLMVVNGQDSLIGAPFVDGAVVKAKVLNHGVGPKVRVFKMRRKKGYRRTIGFRAQFTRLQIVGVDFPGKKESATVATPAEAKPKKATAKKSVEPKAEKKAAPKAKKAEAAEAPAEAAPAQEES